MTLVYSCLTRDFLDLLGDRNTFDGAFVFVTPGEAVKIARGLIPDGSEGPILIVDEVMHPWLKYPIRGVRVDFEGPREWENKAVARVLGAICEWCNENFHPATIPVGMFRQKFVRPEFAPLVDYDLYAKKQNASRQHWNEWRLAQKTMKPLDVCVPTISLDITEQGEQARQAEGDELGLIHELKHEHRAVCLWLRFDNERPDWQQAAVERCIAQVKQLRTL